MLRSSHALVAVLSVALPSVAAAASPQSFKGEYTVSFLGLSIARSTFSSHYENGAYAIEGSVSAAGLAKLFDDTRGTISSKGTISGKPSPQGNYKIDLQSKCSYTPFSCMLVGMLLSQPCDAAGYEQMGIWFRHRSHVPLYCLATIPAAERDLVASSFVWI